MYNAIVCISRCISDCLPTIAAKCSIIGCDLVLGLQWFCAYAPYTIIGALKKVSVVNCHVILTYIEYLYWFLMEYNPGSDAQFLEWFGCHGYHKKIDLLVAYLLCYNKTGIQRRCQCISLLTTCISL